MRDVPTNSAWVASITRAAERDEQRRTNPMTTTTCPHPERHQTQIFIPCQDCDRRAEKTMTTATSTASGKCQCARGVTTPEACIDRLRDTGKHGVRFFYREITGRFKLFTSNVEGVEQITTADSRAYAILIVEALNNQQANPASE